MRRRTLKLGVHHARFGPRPLFVTVVALAVVGAAIAFAARTGSSTIVQSDPAHLNPSADAVAPALSGTDPITGARVSLAEFKGKPVLLSVWASWCTGCNNEAANLARFSLENPKIQVLGIDTLDVTASARSFYQRWHLHQPNIADPNGTLADLLGVSGLPVTLFLDAQHRIVDRLIGVGTIASFEQGARLAEQD